VNQKVLNAFTVDVEDYFQVTAFERDICRSQWNDFPTRVVPNTERLLEMLAENGVSATFFVLGWVAERFPRLVRAIHRAGHQIGSHSYWHKLIYQQSPAEFRADVRRSRDAIADALGQPIHCFRAPTFSITRRSWWALEILVEEGFTVDSSIFPVHHDRYGVPDAQQGIHEISTPAGVITEFPPSTVRLVGRNLPVAGGGYFRLLPARLSVACIERVNSQARPFMFYIHPWEIDADQPRLRAGTHIGRLRHRMNLSQTWGKLHRLLAACRFGRMDESIAQCATSGSPV
jgi:polysaccharide deacetylase family protein (PEP-CTERM system associated)